jgi:PAS domain S-box-containing protein
MLSPLKSPEGIIVTAAIRDITARKEVEQRLLQTEARYRGLLEAAPDAMVVVNERGEIVLLNIRAEEQFGYKRDQLVGRDVTTIIPQGFAERLVADGLRSASEALEQQIGTGIELVGMRRDGSEFPIEIMLSPLQTAEGVLVTAAIRDITVRKANEKALRDNLQEVIRSNAAEARLGELVIELNRSNEDLAQFANIASHDLQEPLRMVTSFTQLLSRRYKGRLDAEADEYIAFAVDGATRMKHLIQDLLAYSRAGAITAFIKISSRDILRQSLARLARAIEQSGAEVTHDALPFVQGDEAQLVQLFEQLISNAIKYQGPGTPRIHISAIATGNRWTISVKDNGLGIEPQYTQKIFGMFQRLHGREFAGTGVGLPICRKIARRHGTDISVESELGQGSTFSLSLSATDFVSNS